MRSRSFQLPAASGELDANPIEPSAIQSSSGSRQPPPLFRLLPSQAPCQSMKKLNLWRGVACDVNRTWPIFFELAARPLTLSFGTYSHALVSMFALARKLGTAVYWPRVLSVP